MEHSTTYTLNDGTEYRLTWDTEDKGGQMHYLLHENGVLKLETWHHAIPEGWSDEDFRSSLVPGTFFNCVSRHMNNRDMAEQVQTGMDEGPAKSLALMALRPHMSLDKTAEEYLSSVAERGHGVELLVKILEDAEVERFRAEMDAEPEAQAEAEAVTPKGARQFVATYWPAISFATVTSVLVIAYLFLVVR